MNKDNILTVAILTYNHEEYIEKTIKSVVDQKTKYHYQILICEDHSTDNTLKICQKYANDYPDKIKLIAQRVNTKRQHTYEALSNVKTKYFTILEGDDYWCDENKIQIAIDFLEANNQYVTFAHDTIYNDVLNKTRKALVREILNIKINNPVTLFSAQYLHMSSRIYRNVIDYKKLFKSPKMRGDLILFYIMLDKGPLYYYDKVMSVYNITGKGMWSKLSKKQQFVANETMYYKINKLLNYKYDDFFTSRIQRAALLKGLKRIFGMRMGWFLYSTLVRFY
jgi:glycosyltransferase involved in cell wall biosynthesis